MYYPLSHSPEVNEYNTNPHHLFPFLHVWSKYYIYSVMELMMQGSKGGRTSNIVTLGYRTRSADGDHGMARGGSVQCDYPNSSVNQLMSHAWEILLDRVGK